MAAFILECRLRLMLHNICDVDQLDGRSDIPDILDFLAQERHQTLSRSLRRGCGLGTRLDSRHEQMLAIFGSVISVVIAGHPHVVCQLCQQYKYSEWSTCNCKCDQLKWVCLSN